VRLTDRDAVLARADVDITDPQHGVFGAYIPIFNGQSGVYEGWSSVRATVEGRSYRFVTAHLEFQQALPVQVAQAQELVALLGNETVPTILVGDFNSDVAGLDPSKATPSYGIVTAAGFTDTWRATPSAPASLSCCQSKDLLNPLPSFTQRIDFVFTRNMPAGTQVLQQRIVGNEPGDRTPSGLWPSDHAGVAVRFLTPPPDGVLAVASK
jgi:endonuclease/exonuclease/phosphatase family metal-dependent hydrolase